MHYGLDGMKSSLKNGDGYGDKLRCRAVFGLIGLCAGSVIINCYIY